MDPTNAADANLDFFRWLHEETIFTTTYIPKLGLEQSLFSFRTLRPDPLRLMSGGMIARTGAYR